MKHKIAYILLGLLLFATFVFLNLYFPKVEFISTFTFPLLFCGSKLLEEAGWTRYKTSYKSDIIGLSVIMGVCALLLIYEWKMAILWILTGTALTLLGVVMFHKR